MIIKKTPEKNQRHRRRKFSGHLIHVMGAKKGVQGFKIKELKALGPVSHGHERISEVLSSLKIFTYEDFTSK